MTTSTAIICNACGFRLDGRVEGFPEDIEWTHPDRECRDFLRERNSELVTALEALVAAMGCIRCVEYVGMGPCPDHGEPLKDAEALLLRLKGG